MTIDYVQHSAATATDGALVAVDTMTVGTATGVAVQLIKFGFGTDEVYTQVATGVGLPVQADAANPVFIQITGSGTATQAVDVSTWSATEAVNLATTATMPVTVTNTATVSILNTSTIIVTQDTATDFNVTPIQSTATSLNVTNMPFGARAAGTETFNTVSATTVATLATGVTNTYRDLVCLVVTNNATSDVQLLVRDTSTATKMNINLAADGGGAVIQPSVPIEQSAQGGTWDCQLESAITGQVYITSKFVNVT